MDPQTDPPPRLGPRPLPLHILTAINGWSSSRGVLPTLRNGSIAWNPDVAPRAEKLRRSLPPESQNQADPFAAAVEVEIAARLDAFSTGVTAYRHHPYRRQLTDPEVAWESGATRLLDYRPDGGRPVLFVPSLVNRAYILDLSERRSFLRWMAQETDLRPLLVDWGLPGPDERRFDLTDYILGPLANALDVARDAAGDRVPVVGYCMGGLLAVALAAHRPDDVAALGLLATPWNFHGERVAQAEVLARAITAAAPLLDAYGELPVDVIQSMFTALDPFLVTRKFIGFASAQPGSQAAEDFVALEDWLNDGVPMSGPVARECMSGWYCKNTPHLGSWEVGGLAVDPVTIDLPARVVIPAQDRIVPPVSAQALADALPNAEANQPPLGHIGMVAGSKARSRVWKPLAEWLSDVS